MCKDLCNEVSLAVMLYALVITSGIELLIYGLIIITLFYEGNTKQLSTNKPGPSYNLTSYKETIL